MAQTLEEVEKNHVRESAKLLELIDKRAVLVNALKLAAPSKIKMVQQAISDMDKLIGRKEEILELIEEQKAQLLLLKKNENELVDMMERIKPEFLKYILEHHPEKLAEMEDLFCDKIDSDTH